MLISYLLHLEYKLGRNVIGTLYQSFILSLFDHADIIMDNCTSAQSSTLQNLHPEATRTIVDSVQGTSH